MTEVFGGPEVPHAEADERADPMTKAVTILIAAIAATSAVSGFFHAVESNWENDETRAGLAATSEASEKSVEAGRLGDVDFDYLSEAEIRVFTAVMLEGQGRDSEAETERLIAYRLLTWTYMYTLQYMNDTVIQDSIANYSAVGFIELWVAWERFVEDLDRGVQEQRDRARHHLEEASRASSKAESFLLSSVLMALAVALGTLALVTRSRALRLGDIAVILVLYGAGLANMGFTFFL